MNLNVSLPETIEPSEELARMIFGGSDRKTQKNYIIASQINPGNFDIKPSVFLDTRNPAELSVNRISTIDYNTCHQLGVGHHIKHKMRASSSYSGFAKINANIVFDQNCAIEKDDVGGTNPYHANIKYPFSAKEDCLAMASALAFHATFILHSA